MRQGLRRHADRKLSGLEGFVTLFNFEPGDDFAAYAKRLDAFRAGRRLSERSVPGCLLVAEVDGEIVGRLSVRYELNASLRDHGGHLGYRVLPDHRRRGYVTRMLQEGLEIRRRRETGPVLVTCDEDTGIRGRGWVA